MACGISSERPSFDFSVFVPMKDWGFCSKARGTWILVATSTCERTLQPLPIVEKCYSSIKYN